MWGRNTFFSREGSLNYVLTSIMGEQAAIVKAIRQLAPQCYNPENSLRT